MLTRVAVVVEPSERAAEREPAVAHADLVLAGATDGANFATDLAAPLGPTPADLPPLALDMVDLAAAVYLTDIAVARGRLEEWTRSISLAAPVRRPDFWNAAATDFRALLYNLTHDNFEVTFYQRPDVPGPEGADVLPADFEPDCVCMLSGGVDSLAGAVTLQTGGRSPMYAMHRSGNPAVLTAQGRVLGAIEGHWPEACGFAPYHVAPHTTERSLPFPAAEEREPSRRARSLLFLAVAEAAAVACGVDEVFMFENGVLSAALPLTLARAGSMSTRSTHPTLLRGFNGLCERAGLAPRVTNPFIYQTKADLVRDVLRPALSPAEVQGTVSCWATGRANRQCGGCVPCLLRRIAMLHAGLPDEAYMVDVLAEPARYAGTDAYGNLMDVLRSARDMLEGSDDEILVSRPGLVALEAAGISSREIILMFRRHAEQVRDVLACHFPQAAKLME